MKLVSDFENKWNSNFGNYELTQSGTKNATLYFNMESIFS